MREFLKRCTRGDIAYLVFNVLSIVFFSWYSFVNRGAIIGLLVVYLYFIINVQRLIEKQKKESAG